MGWLRATRPERMTEHLYQPRCLLNRESEAAMAKRAIAPHAKGSRKGTATMELCVRFGGDDKH